MHKIIIDDKLINARLLLYCRLSHDIRHARDNRLTGDTRKIFVSNIQDRRRVSLGARLDRL